MTIKEHLNNLRLDNLLRNGDIILAIGIVLILFVIIVPLPPTFLDLMLTLSISFSLVVLITAMFVESPVEFSVFPSVVMIATMLRLGLNVATTRRILLFGDQGVDAAGKVIQAFGYFVVKGNYVIGLIIFFILFVLNKMVIARGMQRIGEVSARFTLDAMPGKQMAVDADLNAGLITEEEARRRREEIRREADFYGAMDGAGKFVEGDVNAGIIITIINIIGGLCIGIFQKGMDWGEAARTYTILTIGDGLVSIIPSIIMSTAAGIIVARAADKANLGEEFLGQLVNYPRALKIVSGVLFVFALIPGMPTVPFLILSGILFLLAYISSIHHRRMEKEREKIEEEVKKEEVETPEDIKNLLPLDILAMEVGYALIPFVDEQQGGELLSRIRSIRKQIALEMGVVIPPIHVRDNLSLKPGQYNVLIKGNVVASAEILTDHYLAMDPGTAKKKLKGIETREPAFNLPAIWIPEDQKDEAIIAGYTVVDPLTVIATHLNEVFKNNLHEFLGRQETQELLDTLAKKYPKAVEELVPNILPLGTVQKVLQNLVRERVSIRDLLTIVETLADYGTVVKDPDILTEYVRQRLSRTVVRPYLKDNTLYVLTLEPKIESLLQNNLKRTEEGGYYLAIDPQTAQKIIVAISKTFEGLDIKDVQPVLLVPPKVRSSLAKILQRFIPMLPIISQAEVPPDINLKSVGVVRM